jgi:hypothetical protein
MGEGEGMGDFRREPLVGSIATVILTHALIGTRIDLGTGRRPARDAEGSFNAMAAP